MGLQPTGIIWAAPVTDIGGYGTATRNYLRSASLLGLPISIYNLTPHKNEISREERGFLAGLHSPVERLGPRPVLFIHATPDLFPLLSAPMAAKRIGITLFETDRIPKGWASACNETVDEVWVATRFNRETFGGSGVKREKLKVVPIPLDAGKYQAGGPLFPFGDGVKTFKFLFVGNFDYRKGLDLLIRSYCREFGPDEDVSLVLKLYTPDWEAGMDTVSLLQSYIPEEKRDSCPHLLIMDRKSTEEELLSLYRTCDCFVTAERGAGWGIPPMEMMAMGKPAIAIKWSGFTEFMNDGNAFMIPHGNVMEDVDPRLQLKRPEYRGHQWVSVTEEQVRKVMREAYGNEAKRERLGLRAGRDIAGGYSIEAVAERMRTALWDGGREEQPCE